VQDQPLTRDGAPPAGRKRPQPGARRCGAFRRSMANASPGWRVLAPDLKRPVVCFDESPTQIGEVRLPIPADPCRARPDRATSDNIGLQIGPGGSISISATTRSRSVTGTVSPAASRTNSFERFEANEPACPLRLQWLERRATDVRAGASRYEIDRAAGHGSLKEVESFLALPSQSSSRRALPRRRARAARGPRHHVKNERVSSGHVIPGH
jgi:hypothetical protein